MKRLLAPMRRLVPLRVRRTAAQALEIALAKAGRWRVRCPVCGWRFRAFRPAGHARRENARCPRCDALERHRLQWLYLCQRTGLFTTPLRVLHFAPEPSFRARLAAVDTLRYVTTDLADPDVDLNSDITALPFAAGTFDLILCSHVLEHVPDDGAALRELFRVLKAGGCALVDVPVDAARERTFEDPSVRDAAGRLRLFGQEDHVRVYGRDYIERVRAAGFDAEADDFVERLPTALVERHALPRQPIFIARRPRGAAGSVAATTFQRATS